MTIDEAIALVKIERECVIRADVCDRKCEKCDLVQDSTELTDMYEHLAEWLEELKAIKEMDLSIPQHFTKEQSDWIKTYCIKRNIEFYNKAIDDFVNVCEKQFTTVYGQRYLDMRDIVNIAEQLKAGGKRNAKCKL